MGVWWETAPGGVLNPISNFKIKRPHQKGGQVSMRKRFPVLHNPNYRGETECIPWEVIAPHEAQAHKNHSQSLERLAARGGIVVSRDVRSAQG